MMTHESVTTWQPMKTAPKNGQRVLVVIHAIGAPAGNSFIRMAYYNTDEWYFEDSGHSAKKYGYKLTHWTELPKCPKQ